MSGTINGGKLAAQKNLAKDPDHYRKIGAKGGIKSRGGGFTKADPEKARIAGRKGGNTTWERHSEQMRAAFIERRKARLSQQ